MCGDGMGLFGFPVAERQGYFLFEKGLSKADVLQSLAADETINDLVRYRATKLARD